MSTPLCRAFLSVWTLALAIAPAGCRQPAPAAPPPSVSAPVILTAPPAPPAVDVPEPEPEVALSPPGPDLFVRNQPWLRGIRAWDGSLVALGGGGDGSYRIDPLSPPEKARAVPLVIPGTTRVVDVAMQGETPVALVVAGGGLALALRRDASWSIEPVPEPSRAPEEVTLAASPDALVLLYPGQLHVLRAGSWTSVRVGPQPVSEVLRQRAVRRGLLTRDHLLLGSGAGEWGGALASLDLATGAWKAYPAVDEPVKDLVPGPDGKPWVVTGLAHLGGLRGSLSRLDASGLKAFAKVEGSHLVGEPVTHVRLGWELPPASFEAIAFDEEHRLHLLTGAVGVVRREGKRWARLTPALPVPLTGLAVRGHLLVITTFDAGVLLWDVATGRARRVELTR